MGIIEDSLDGIFASVRESALTMQRRGVGFDFSTLRPQLAVFQTDDTTQWLIEVSDTLNIRPLSP